MLSIRTYLGYPHKTHHAQPEERSFCTMWKTFHDYQPTTTDDMVLIYVVECDVIKGSEPPKINIKPVRFSRSSDGFCKPIRETSLYWLLSLSLFKRKPITWVNEHYA